MDLNKGKIFNDAPKRVGVQPVPRALRDLWSARRRLEKPREAPARKRVFDHIKEQPGESLASFKRRLNLAHNKLRTEKPALPPKGISEKRKRYLDKTMARKKEGGKGGKDAFDGSLRPLDQGDRRGNFSRVSAEDNAGDLGHTMPFATRMSDYHSSLLPVDVRRAKRKAEESGGVQGFDSWRKSDAPQFGERVNEPPRFKMLPNGVKKGILGGSEGGRLRASSGDISMKMEEEARRAIDLKAAQLEVERDKARKAFAELKERRAAVAAAAAAAAAATGAKGKRVLYA